jgi:hypothetical protein
MTSIPSIRLSFRLFSLVIPSEARNLLLLAANEVDES